MSAFGGKAAIGLVPVSGIIGAITLFGVDPLRADTFRSYNAHAIQKLG